MIGEIMGEIVNPFTEHLGKRVLYAYTGDWKNIFEGEVVELLPRLVKIGFQWYYVDAIYIIHVF